MLSDLQLRKPTTLTSKVNNHYSAIDLVLVEYSTIYD